MFARIRILLVTVALAFIWWEASADDVYNFYFQKAPGPQTVIQTGNTKPEDLSKVMPGSAAVVQGAAAAPAAAASEPAAPAAATATTSVPAPATASEPRQRRWTIGAGMAAVNDHFAAHNPRLGYRAALYGDYMLTRFLSVDMSLKLAALEADRSDSKEPYLALMLPTLGFSMIPIHINIFGADTLDIGVEGGAGVGAFNGEYWESDPKITLAGYYGLVAQLNLPMDFSVRAHARSFSNLAGEMVATLNYTF